jgi:hypothetical protein
MISERAAVRIAGGAVALAALLAVGQRSGPPSGPGATCVGPEAAAACAIADAEADTAARTAGALR